MKQVTAEAVYADAPITQRDGAKLAKRYGFKDLEAFAADIPPHARVVDVGAGRSSLGHDVCSLRDDVRWINVDLSYAKGDVKAKLTEDAPSNLELVAANAISLDAELGEDRFDRVYSYWMLPHVLLAGKRPGLRAIENMFRIAKPAGSIALGPYFRWKDPSGVESKPSSRVAVIAKPDTAEAAKEIATGVAKGLEMSIIMRHLQRRYNLGRFPFTNARILQAKEETS